MAAAARAAASGSSKPAGGWFANVDWSRTKAYALGLSGLFINQRGREANGIVEPGAETEAVKRQIVEGLNGMLDPEANEASINGRSGEFLRRTLRRQRAGSDHRLQPRPRASWEGAVGRVTDEVFMTTQVERRSLHRSAAGAGRAVLELAHAGWRAADSGPRADDPRDVRRRQAESHDGTRSSRRGAGGDMSRRTLHSRPPRCGLLRLQRVRGANAPSRMVILGVDGMDPKLLAQYMEEGVVPNLSRLASTGGFMPLGTSIPPQSPVAWSTFITGMDPGSHGIFDFLHLDRENLTPYMSTSRIQGTSLTLPMGRWRIPLKSPHAVAPTRHGVLGAARRQRRAHAAVSIPANYPPVETSGQAISGMGTPDLQGTSGTFTLYTTDPNWKAGTVSGGIIERVALRDGAGSSRITGPPNALLKSSPNVTADCKSWSIRRIPSRWCASATAGCCCNRANGATGCRCRFDLMPHVSSVSGMVRFYLKQVRPHLLLYMTPVNIDPRAPAQAIAAPSKYAYELAEDAGPFYTEEMPEDAKALRAGVLLRTNS